MFRTSNRFCGDVSPDTISIDDMLDWQTTLAIGEPHARRQAGGDRVGARVAAEDERDRWQQLLPVAKYDAIALVRIRAALPDQGDGFDGFFGKLFFLYFSFGKAKSIEKTRRQVGDHAIQRTGRDLPR